MELSELIRPNILVLKSYSCARDEYDGEDALFLDANENPYPNGCNRYPDPRHRLLRQRIAELRGVALSRIVIGNGSDELIDMLIRSTCRPGMDNIAVFVPGYLMYEVSAAVNDIEVRRIDLSPDFQPSADTLMAVADANTKLAFLCSPNNPTGNVVTLPTIAEICRVFSGLVIVDEAYIDFADSASAISLLAGHDNLFILQTLSKSWGMAGLRIGIGIGDPQFAAVLDKVKPPYNISGIAQQKALELLRDTDGFKARIAEIRSERERLARALAGFGIFRRIYPSEANFLLVETPDFRRLYTFLAGAGVIVRIRDIPPLIPDCLRISIGTPEENNELLKRLEQWKNLQL